MRRLSNFSYNLLIYFEPLSAKKLMKILVKKHLQNCSGIAQICELLFLKLSVIQDVKKKTNANYDPTKLTLTLKLKFQNV